MDRYLKLGNRSEQSADDHFHREQNENRRPDEQGNPGDIIDVFKDQYKTDRTCNERGPREVKPDRRRRNQNQNQIRSVRKDIRPCKRLRL